ncbi:Tripartite-type tricarboxylate transporter, receptor component TctC [Azotobacter beijerinckii]|uniref:Tripartite-type tricarboxylate transporter, receptor component TctC n=1 Tax=Azotobacter beijerinckii TaxID=170623 RepID=A0A1H9PEB2_9GAMM|nr:tripartite tricarboxylate transporter substrate binding protein [Azotobacter beijerinckii]SER46521.1 Tripartite-type tricarboxylate transporter, receptor component TctC [Azotobacter beijerinckii]
MQKRTFLLATLAAAVGLSLQGAAQAASYPNRPIELVVPAVATGASDLSARIFAKYAEKRIGKPVVVVRISGAGGYNGSRAVREDKSNGYQVLYTHQGLIANYLTKVAPYSYDGFKVGPAVVEDATLGLYASGKSGIKSINDLLARARAEPGKLKAATEYGTLSHFMFLKLQKEQGVTFKLMDTGGDAARLAAMLGGTVDVMAKVYSGTQDYLKSGDFALLGEPADKRAPNAPEVPTYKEQGVDFTFPPYVWSLFFNQNTPQAIVDTWTEVAREVTSDPAYRKEIEALDMAWTYKSPEENAAAHAGMQQAFAELVGGMSAVAKQ